MLRQHRPTLARLSPLLALLALALVPYGWLTELSPPFRAVMYWVFATEAAHAVGHTLIFLAVGAALLAVFPGLLRRPGRYLSIVLLVAVAQEGLQLLYKGRGVIRNDLTDIAIDMVAAGLVLALARAAARGGARRVL